MLNYFFSVIIIIFAVFILLYPVSPIVRSGLFIPKSLLYRFIPQENWFWELISHRKRARFCWFNSIRKCLLGPHLSRYSAVSSLMTSYWLSASIFRKGEVSHSTFVAFTMQRRHTDTHTHSSTYTVILTFTHTRTHTWKIRI